MGLDMYLSAKRYLSPYLNKEDEPKIKTLNEVFFDAGLTRKEGEYDRVITIKEVTAEIAYWRKANAIHKWFVDNVQGGVDECQESFVSREQLQQLLETCKKVLAKPKLAMELLPPQSGFFFGTTEVDEWYMQDLENTVERLEQVLNAPVFEKGWDFYYQSSW